MQNAMPVIVCYGPETFLQQEFISRLIDSQVDADSRDFAVSRYDLAETPVDQVIDEAETAPFMVPVKIIIAKNALFLTGVKDSGKVEHKVERLTEYLKSPADHSIVILTVDAVKLDERKKIVKTLKEQKCLKPFLALSPDELGKWAVRRGEQLGVTFQSAAVERFVLYTGGELQAMATELDKLSLYAGADRVITENMVDTLVVRSTEQNVFILMEDVVQKRMDRAFAIFYELLKQKEEPIKLVMLMARQFRLILQVKDLAGQGYSQQQIASQIGSHPYPVKLAAEQGRRYSLGQLNEILTGLAELDYQMKSGRIDKVLGLELFMLRLAG